MPAPKATGGSSLYADIVLLVAKTVFVEMSATRLKISAIAYLEQILG